MWLLEAQLGLSKTVLGRPIAGLLERLESPLGLSKSVLWLPIARLLESSLRGLPVALLWLAEAMLQGLLEALQRLVLWLPVGGRIVLLCSFSSCPAHIEQCDLLSYLISAIEGKGDWEALETIYSLLPRLCGGRLLPRKRTERGE
jgi:hypothetical protein